MYKKLMHYCKLFALIMSGISWNNPLFSLTESAVRTSENIKNELAVLLKKDTAAMSATEYAAWKKKVDDGLAYLMQVFPAIVPNYQRAVELREETYQVAHNISDKQLDKSASSEAIKAPILGSLINQAPVLMPTTDQVGQDGLAMFNKALEKIKHFPEEIKTEVQQLQLKPGSLPLFYLKWQEIDAIDDLFAELLTTSTVNADMKKNYHDQRDLVLKSLSNGAADLCNAVLTFVLTHSNGLKAQLALSNVLAQIDTVEELTKGSWGDIEHAMFLFLPMNDLLQEGCWQDNDLLITLLPTINQDKVGAIKTNLNNMVNHTQKNGSAIGMYDQLVENMKKFLQNLDHVIDTASLNKTVYDLFDKQADLLTDYLACMLEYEGVVLKHYNQKGIEISSIDSYGAEELILLLNTIKQKIDAHSSSDAANKKGLIHDLLVTLDTAPVAMHKAVEAFVNPVTDTIPNIGALYGQIEKTYAKYLDLIHGQQIGTKEQDDFLHEYDKTLKDLDTQTIIFANKILTYIENQDNLQAINTWLKKLVSDYAKGTKKISTLSVDNENQFKIYAKLIQVLSLLFAKGVALEGQSTNLDTIVKRALVEQRVLTNFENHLNTLFNTAKDTDGVLKGLVSRAIEAIDSILLLAQEYMASMDVLIVKAYQVQITPLVQFLEQLFAMENELVVPELQKFVKKNVSNPFSSTTILEDARALIDPAHAESLAVHISTVSKTNALPTQASLQGSSQFMNDILAVLDNVQHDVTTKLASVAIPNTIPSFADQYAHVVQAEELYHDAKQEFSTQDKDAYKLKSLQILQSIDTAVIQVALKVATFICQQGGLFEKQLAYIDTVRTKLKNGQTTVVDVVQSKDFAAVLKDAQLLQKICQKGFLSLKVINPAIFQLEAVKKDVGALNSLLNKMMDSSLDVKTKNAPNGLCDKLVAAWINFFDDWKQSVKKSTLDTIQQVQRQLKPILDLLSCYRTVINTLQEAAVVMPIVNKGIPSNFMDTIESMLNARNAASLIELSVENSTMQPKQTTVAGNLLTPTAKTIPLTTTAMPTTTATASSASATTSTASSTAKTSTKAPASTVPKKESVVVLLDSFGKLKRALIENITEMNVAKGVIPEIKDFFDMLEAIKDDFEFDSALQAISTDDNAKVEAAYQELLLFGLQQAFVIGKGALEYGNSSLKAIVKDLAGLLKTYEADTSKKKIAEIKKDQAFKAVCDRIKAVDDLYNKSVFQLVKVKAITVKGTINTLDAFLAQLNILVDSSMKNNAYVGILNQLLEEWQTLFNDVLGCMKTLTVDKVIAYQQDLLFLQDTCTLLDKFVAKLILIVDGKRVTIKKGVIASAFADTLQKITKKENASSYAKGSSAETGDVQRALISLTDSMSKKK